MGYIIAFILGIMICSIGVKGVVNIADKGVEVVKSQSKELAK
jgi:hypothetical protein